MKVVCGPLSAATAIAEEIAVSRGHERIVTSVAFSPRFCAPAPRRAAAAGLPGRARPPTGHHRHNARAPGRRPAQIASLRRAIKRNRTTSSRICRISPVSRITFPTCCAHYPGGSNGCSCRLLPRPRGLPRYAGGSASATSLSRPAQASLASRPVELLDRPRRPLSRGFDPANTRQTALQLPDLSATIWVDSSSTGYPCLFGHTA
jgi:hypothetical protein